MILCLTVWVLLRYNVTMGENSITSKCCEDMIEAGITDAASKEGLDFCIDKCRYPNGCILFDSFIQVEKRKEDRRILILFAKRLHWHKVSTADIALILQVSQRQVERYIQT